MRTATHAFALAGATLLLHSCGHDAPPSPDGGADGPPRVEIRIVEAEAKPIDLLFMVDNSGSSDPMSDQLKVRFGRLTKVFDDLAANGQFADLQIGVVTSDYGAGAMGAPGCQPSPGGQQGRLVDRGAGAAIDCKTPVGARFIRYAFGANGKRTHNLPPGQDLIQTFTCMATVITTQAAGCGFEHPLESVYAALHNDIPENRGFLRDGARLVVVYFTGEDDCSAPADSDLFDKNKVMEYGFLGSFRCTRFGVLCGDAARPPPYGDSMGPLAQCRSAPNPGGAGPGKLFDVSRYIDYFTLPKARGGVKERPSDVILAGIMPPAEPFEAILSSPGTPGNQPYVKCAPLNGTSNPPCVPVLQHSCQDLAKPAFFGDPPVRIAQVIRAAPFHYTSSLCNPDYSQALTDIGTLAALGPTAGCVAEPIANPANPDCTVSDVLSNLIIPACANPPKTFPCWRVEKKPVCANLSPQGIGITIDRDGQKPPPGTETRAACIAP